MSRFLPLPGFPAPPPQDWGGGLAEAHEGEMLNSVAMEQLKSQLECGIFTPSILLWFQTKQHAFVLAFAFVFAFGSHEKC